MTQFPDEFNRGQFANEPAANQPDAIIDGEQFGGMGGFGGGFDMNALLQQAQALQEQLQSAQADLGNQEVTGSAGGDLVTVTMTGTQEVRAVTIKPEAVDPADVETLEDLVLAAFRDAASKATELAQSVMPTMPF